MIDQHEATGSELLCRDETLIKAQAQARSERQRYRELFDAVPEGLLITSQTGEILESNPAAARRLQIPASAKGRPRIFDFLLEAEAPEVRRGLEHLGERNRVVRFAVRMQTGGGELLETSLTVTWLEWGDSHAAPRLRWMMQEVESGGLDDLRRRVAELEETTRTLERQIAERRRVEDEVVRRGREVEKRLEKRTLQFQDVTRAQNSMARFLGEVCARPLRELGGHVQTLLDRWDSSLPPEARRQMDLVRGKARELTDLLESVAAYARTARQPLERTTADTAALVSEVLDVLAAEFADRCVEIRCGELPECSADPALLRLVFHHLLSNALKFTRTRETAVIEILCQQAGKELIFSVRDNGIGFQKDQLHRLFQPFQRLHRTQGYPGAGVGLATAHQAIARHEGRIWARPNSNGVGATFFFALPGPEGE